MSLRRQKTALEVALIESAEADAQPSGRVHPRSDLAPAGETARAEGTESGASERETTPAPPTSASIALGASLKEPAWFPAFDFATGETSAHRRIPIDVAVPVRTKMPVPEDLPHRLAFLLFVVDGRSSCADLAAQNELPLEDVLASFVDLVGAGLVEFRDAAV